MLSEVRETIGGTLYQRLKVKPRQASRFRPLIAGVICAKMLEGKSFYAATAALGLSSATVARWIRWGRDGEDPYSALIECAELAQREYLSRKLGADPEAADYVLKRLTGGPDHDNDSHGGEI